MTLLDFRGLRAFGARPTRNIRRRIRVLGALCILSCVLGGRAANAAYLEPELSRLGNYSETFTFVADLVDGSYVHISLALTNLGPGSLKGLCRAIVVPNAAHTFKAGQRVDRDDFQWSAGRDGNEVLRIGTCSAWLSGEETGVEVSLEKGTVKLLFSGRPKKRSLLHVASVLVEHALYRSEVLLLRTPVVATLGLPDATPRTVNGAGYVDHSFCTVSPKDLASRWVRFRALRSPRALVVFGRQGFDGRFSPLWACEGPERCEEFASFNVEKRGDGLQTQYTVSLSGDSKPPVELRSETLLYRDAALEDLGLLGKLIAPIVGASVTYVYRAEASFGAGEPVEGILEVETHGG